MNKRPFIKPEVRKIIINLLKRGRTYQEAADALGVGVASVNRIWRRYRQTGSYDMAPRGGGQRPGIKESEEVRFKALVDSNYDATYDELTSLWNRSAKRKVSRSVIVRMVKKIGYSLKKKAIIATENLLPKNRAKLKAFLMSIAPMPPDSLVYLDESGFAAKLRRTRARALVGKKAVSFYPCFSAKNITICGAIRAQGPVVMEGRPKSMTRKWFLSFLRRRLFPRLRPGDTLVLDNLSAHRGESINALARVWSIRLLYLPPYSSEFNAIEMVWAWMKSRLRARSNRMKACFRYAIAGAWRKAGSLNFPGLVTAAMR